MKIIAIISAVVFAASLWSSQSVAGEDLDRLDKASYCLGLVSGGLQVVEASMKGEHPADRGYDSGQQLSAIMNKLRLDLMMYLKLRKYNFRPAMLKGAGDWKACKATIEAQVNQCKQMCADEPNQRYCVIRKKCLPFPFSPLSPGCAKIAKLKDFPAADANCASWRTPATGIT
jgi:hypothetical protein